jgi:hypothetical protein
MKTERFISMRWNSRNIERVRARFGLAFDMCGFILKNGQRIGYKTAYTRTGRICFSFTNAAAIGLTPRYYGAFSAIKRGIKS